MLRLSNEAYDMIEAANYRYSVFSRWLPEGDLKLVDTAKRVVMKARPDQAAHDPKGCSADDCYVCLVVHRSPHWRQSESLLASMKDTQARIGQLRLKIYDAMSKKERQAALSERELMEAERLHYMRAGLAVLDAVL